MALVATSVRAAPSVGSRTMASTPSLMNVSTWLICRLASFVPSATMSSTSSYFSASLIAAELMAPSHPWSAAGPEKPIVMVPSDAPPPLSLDELFSGAEVSGVVDPDVQAVMSERAATAAPVVRTSLPMICRVLRIVFLLELDCCCGCRGRQLQRPGGLVPVCADESHSTRT
jgi:hypothetical protein